MQKKKNKKREPVKCECVVCAKKYEATREDSLTCGSTCRRKLFVAGFNKATVRVFTGITAKLQLVENLLKPDAENRWLYNYVILPDGMVHVFRFTPEFLNVRNKLLNNQRKFRVPANRMEIEKGLLEQYQLAMARYQEQQHRVKTYPINETSENTPQG